MIAAVSTGILPENTPAQTVTKPGSRKKKKGGVPDFVSRQPWFAEPDLSDEADTAMYGAAAGASVHDVFRLIVKLLNRKCYALKSPVRREQAQAGLLNGVGVKGLARHLGCTPRTVRRRLAWLEEHGYLRVLSNDVEIVTHDPLTGQITTNTIGRRKAVSIQVTVDASCCRPRKKPKAANRGSQSPHSVPHEEHDRGSQSTHRGDNSDRYRGSQSTTFPTSYETLEKRQPPSSGESGSGRRFEEEQRQPRPFTGDDAARKAATLARIEREKAQREAEDEAFRQRAAYAAPAAAEPPHSKREEESVEKPRTAAQPHPRPSRPPSRKEERGEAGWNQDEMLRLLNEQVAAALRSPDGVSMTRAEYPARAIEREVA